MRKIFLFWSWSEYAKILDFVPKTFTSSLLIFYWCYFYFFLYFRYTFFSNNYNFYSTSILVSFFEVSLFLVEKYKSLLAYFQRNIFGWIEPSYDRKNDGTILILSYNRKWCSRNISRKKHFPFLLCSIGMFGIT